VPPAGSGASSAVLGVRASRPHRVRRCAAVLGARASRPHRVRRWNTLAPWQTAQIGNEHQKAGIA
ncbi:hypothetical protein, partial [Roseiflexus sp.]